MTKQIKIPPLIFGMAQSKIDFDLYQMQKNVSKVTNWVTEYDVLVQAEHKQLQHRASVFQHNNVRLLSVSSTPTVMKVFDPDCTIAIPAHGKLKAWVDGKSFTIENSNVAMYYPRGKRHTEGDLKSVMLISIPQERLLQTARLMIGKDAAGYLNLHTPRKIETRYGAVDFFKILIKQGGLIDQFSGNTELLKHFSVDDSIVRIVVMMLCPACFFGEQSIREEGVHADRNLSINLLCEYISANLNQQLNLTILESVSGTSSRVLQLEFKKRFACSPMQWVREQRLLSARRLLINSCGGASVSAVAAQCGFENFSGFAKRYAERFSELPRETLKRL